MPRHGGRLPVPLTQRHGTTRRNTTRQVYAQDLNAKVPRMREDFDDVRSILSLLYFSRPSSGACLALPCLALPTRVRACKVRACV